MIADWAEPLAEQQQHAAWCKLTERTAATDCTPG
jgi:hypothetical protein